MVNFLMVNIAISTYTNMKTVIDYQNWELANRCNENAHLYRQLIKNILIYNTQIKYLNFRKAAVLWQTIKHGSLWGSFSNAGFKSWLNKKIKCTYKNTAKICTCHNTNISKQIHTMIQGSMLMCLSQNHIMLKMLLFVWSLSDTKLSGML